MTDQAGTDLTDAAKILMLADWFDKSDDALEVSHGIISDRSIQKDLRRWAVDAENLAYAKEVLADPKALRFGRLRKTLAKLREVLGGTVSEQT